MFDTRGAQPVTASGKRNNNRAVALRAAFVTGQWQRGIPRIRGCNCNPLVGAFTPMVIVYFLSVFLYSFQVREKQRLTFSSSVTCLSSIRPHDRLYQPGASAGRSRNVGQIAWSIHCLGLTSIPMAGLRWYLVNKSDGPDNLSARPTEPLPVDGTFPALPVELYSTGRMILRPVASMMGVSRQIIGG